MPQYTNFYETQKEAQMRLQNTVILYDEKPFYVLAIGDHFEDGVFRIYLDDCLDKRGPAFRRSPPLNDILNYGYGNKEMCQKLDTYLDKNKDETVIRKMMNSPAFNKFRPFPLGMVNMNGKVVYVERQPVRSTQQGLTESMANSSPVSIIPGGNGGRYGINVWSREMARTIINDYPSPGECLSALTDDRVANEGAAFHRMFALFRGPLDMIFLAYKSDIVGILTNHDFSVVNLGKKFKHCKEVIQELGVFNEIKVR